LVRGANMLVTSVDGTVPGKPGSVTDLDRVTFQVRN
jgi:hypothetical protein